MRVLLQGAPPCTLAQVSRPPPPPRPPSPLMRRTSRFVAIDTVLQAPEPAEPARASDIVGPVMETPEGGVGAHLREVLKPYGGTATMVFGALLIETMVGALVPLAFRTLIDR